MRKSLSHVWKSFVNGGVNSEDTLYFVRIKNFFNVITLYGIVTGLMQIIMAFPFDKYAALFHSVWTLACVVSLIIIRFNYFKLARFIVFFFVFVFGGLAASRLGNEFYPHFASFGIVVACFIMHDFKREWGWIAFFMALEFTMILLVESNAYKSENVVIASPYFFRTSTLIGTMVFVMIEFAFYIKLTIRNERIHSNKVQLINKELVTRDEEKNTLLKEIHHRVKNNLQIISSLLRLQSNEIKDGESKQKFKNAVNRIQSISLLHEVMYKSDNLMRINLVEYLHAVVTNLADSYGLPRKIKLDIESDFEKTQNDSIIPLSLILNELLTNSLKHAFTDQDDCVIIVKLKHIENNLFLLNYSDNGTWKPSISESSFGIELIKSLTEQLDGEIEELPEKGKSDYVIRFRVNDFN